RIGMTMAPRMSKRLKRPRLLGASGGPPPPTPPRHALRARGEGSAGAVASGKGEFESGALYRLMAWLSPAFPVGAFSYSSGIEWAVEAGDIQDASSLQRWLAIVVAEGGGFCDAAIFANAHRATQAGDDTSLRAIAEFAVA